MENGPVANPPLQARYDKSGMLATHSTPTRGSEPNTNFSSFALARSSSSYGHFVQANIYGLRTAECAFLSAMVTSRRAIVCITPPIKPDYLYNLDWVPHDLDGVKILQHVAFAARFEDKVMSQTASHLRSHWADQDWLELC